MTRYALIESGVVVNIPLAEDPEFAAEQGWIGPVDETVAIGDLYDGQAFSRSEPEPAESPVPVDVTPLQFRRAARQLGLRAEMDAYLAGADDEVQEAFEYATRIRRDSAVLAAAALEMGKTEAEVDDLFRLAATFPAS